MSSPQQLPGQPQGHADPDVLMHAAVPLASFYRNFRDAEPNSNSVKRVALELEYVEKLPGAWALALPRMAELAIRWPRFWLAVRKEQKKRRNNEYQKRRLTYLRGQTKIRKQVQKWHDPGSLPGRRAQRCRLVHAAATEADGAASPGGRAAHLAQRLVHRAPLWGPRRPPPFQLPQGR